MNQSNQHNNWELVCSTIGTRVMGLVTIALMSVWCPKCASLKVPLWNFKRFQAHGLSFATVHGSGHMVGPLGPLGDGKTVKSGNCVLTVTEISACQPTEVPQFRPQSAERCLAQYGFKRKDILFQNCCFPVLSKLCIDSIDVWFSLEWLQWLSLFSRSASI